METSEVKKILKKLGRIPNRVMGQNFLIDGTVLKRIANSLPTGGTILEIGAGLGALTFQLPQAAKIVAIEKDPILAGWLKEEGARQDYKNLTVVPGDILKQPSEWFLGIGPYFAVGNIPYYLTTRLIRKLLEEVPAPQEIIFTIQKEVAERIVAKRSGSSLLSIAVQVYGEPEILFSIPRNKFWPMPTVDSAVIKIANISKHNFPHLEDEQLFFKILRTAFQGKRKVLTNTLAGLYGKEGVRTALGQIGKSEHARPEELNVVEWCSLVRRLSEDALS